MWQISRLIGLGFLAGLSVEDIRTKKVSEELLVMMTVLAAGYQIVFREISWFLVLSGAGAGMVFLLISYMTREALGYGDSILICILGIFVGAAELIEILVLTWSAVLIVSVILLWNRRFSRKAALPFVPFLSLGYSVVTVCTYFTKYTEV